MNPYDAPSQPADQFQPMMPPSPAYQHPQPPQPVHHYRPPYVPQAAAPQMAPVPQQPVPPAPMPAPMPPAPAAPALPPQLPQQPELLRPVPVVKVLSPVGVEYVFLTITLLIGGSALAGTLLALCNGGFNFAALAFPAATLLVTVPLFALIFLHLKRLELRMPELKLDPSKRRSTQATQIITFVVCLFTVIGFFAAAFAAMGGGIGTSIGKMALDALSVLVVAGGILFYYWRDEHGTGR
ncbi:MAG TPA: hypothetical protein VLF71_05540 [Candidatus Saccharimonadales bacterium]|nr:hypothetical protein [Candidatus Saccharimonadales bacterium]